MSAVKQSLRAVQKSLSGRVEDLEQNFGQVLGTLNQKFQNIEQRLTNMELTAEALATIAGMDEVLAARTTIAAKRKADQIAKDTAELDAGVADGYMVPEEVVNENSFIVGKITQGDTVTEPRVQDIMPKIDKAVQEKLMGKKVGETVEFVNNSLFELTGIYRVDQEKFKEVAAAKQAAMQQAAAQPVAEAVQEAATVAATDETAPAAAPEQANV